MDKLVYELLRAELMSLEAIQKDLVEAGVSTVSIEGRIKGIQDYFTLKFEEDQKRIEENERLLKAHIYSTQVDMWERRNRERQEYRVRQQLKARSVFHRVWYTLQEKWDAVWWEYLERVYGPAGTLAEETPRPLYRESDIRTDPPYDR